MYGTVYVWSENVVNKKRKESRNIFNLMTFSWKDLTNDFHVIKLLVMVSSQLLSVIVPNRSRSQLTRGECSSERFWSPFVCLSACLSKNCSHRHRFLQNHCTYFHQTWYKSSLDEGDSHLFKWKAMPPSKERMHRILMPMFPSCVDSNCYPPPHPRLHL